MKPLILPLLALSLTSCTATLDKTDAWLLKKIGLDTVGVLTLGLSAKSKGEQLKKEYETLKVIEVTAQK
jgi:hypothetical protein